MKNIAILHYTCPPVIGGVEEIVRQQAVLFRRYFYPVKVLAGKGRVFLPDLAIEVNPLLTSDHPEILNAQQKGTAYNDKVQAFSYRIENYLKEHLYHFDVLIAHNVLTMPFNIPLTLALHRIADQKFIRTISWNHDSPFFYSEHPVNPGDPYREILRTYNKNIEYVAISESRSKEFQELYGIAKPLPVIPNGIDPIDFFRLESSTVRLINEQDLFSVDLILVQPSRLHPRKNIEKSIQVLRAYKDRGVKAKLLITGAFDPHDKSTFAYYQKLDKMAKRLNIREDMVVVMDYTFEDGQKLIADRLIIRDLYLISDILFLPSYQEGFGIPLLEAGMIKLPVACSDIPPFRGIANQDVLYFDPNDDAMLISKKIDDFLAHSPTFRMHRNVIRQYAWDNIFRSKLRAFLEK